MAFFLIDRAGPAGPARMLQWIIIRGGRWRGRPPRESSQGVGAGVAKARFVPVPDPDLAWVLGSCGGCGDWLKPVWQPWMLVHI